MCFDSFIFHDLVLSFLHCRLLCFSLLYSVRFGLAFAVSFIQLYLISIFLMDIICEIVWVIPRHWLLIRATRAELSLYLQFFLKVNLPYFYCFLLIKLHLLLLLYKFFFNHDVLTWFAGYFFLNLLKPSLWVLMSSYCFHTHIKP